MDKAIARYGNTNLLRYNGKAFLNSISKLHKEQNSKSANRYKRPCCEFASGGQPNWEEV